MYLLKQKQPSVALRSDHRIALTRATLRNLKVLLSIGGYTWSQADHFAFMADDALVKTFIDDAVTMVEDFGLDGMCVASRGGLACATDAGAATSTLRRSTPRQARSSYRS